MSEETIFEDETERTAGEAAAVLRELADGFESGTTLSFGDGTIVAAPKTMEVEVEVERDGPAGGPAELEIELEFEWFVEGPEGGDGSVEGREGMESEGGSADGSTDDAAGESDPGSAVDVAPPDDDTGDVSTDPVEVPAVTSLARFQVYRDRGDEWRWRLVHRNGNIIATGGEGYASRQNARKGLRSVMTNAPGAAVDDVDG